MRGGSYKTWTNAAFYGVLPLLFLLSLILAGCGGPETLDEPPRNVREPQDVPVGQIEQGGTARIVLPGETTCRNVYFAECRGAEALSGVVFESPLVVGPSVEYRPLLAESVPSYATGTLGLAPFTVEVRLRAGAAWSDGEPVTSADVRWSYEKAAELARSGAISPLYAGFARLERVETPDDRTARLVFGEPFAPWKDLLTAPVLPRHVYEDREFGPLMLDENLLGSGPFLPETAAGDGLRFRANERYWIEDSGLPNLGGLEVRFAEPDSAAEALSSGEANFGTVRSLNLGETTAAGELRFAPVAPVQVEQLLFNSRRLDNREIRETLSRAVDRSGVARAVGGDNASADVVPVARSFVPPRFVTGYVPAWEDPGEAPGPEGLSGLGTLDLVYPEDERGTGREGVARQIVSDLEAAGARVETRSVPSGEFFGRVLPEGDFDLALYAGGPPAEYGAMLPSLPPEGAESLAGSLAALETDERTRLLSEAQRELAAESAVLPLFVWSGSYAWSSGLSGPRPETPYRSLLWNVREWGFFK